MTTRFMTSSRRFTNLASVRAAWLEKHGRTTNAEGVAFFVVGVGDGVADRREQRRAGAGAAGAQHHLLRHQRADRQGRRPRRPRGRRCPLPAARGGGRRRRQDLARLSQRHPKRRQAKGVNARDRIGSGPWQNVKGVEIAKNVDDLHSANNKLTGETALTERGNRISGVGFTPNWHDALTGSDRDGRAFPGNMNMTCNGWKSSEFGKAMLGHIDRTGARRQRRMRAPGIRRISRAAAPRRTSSPPAATGCSTASRSDGTLRFDRQFTTTETHLKGKRRHEHDHAIVHPRLGGAHLRSAGPASPRRSRAT